MNDTTTTPMTFSAKLGDHQIDGECVNPGDWFGKAWILEIGVGFSSFYFAVEGDCEQDVIDNFIDLSERRHLLLIEDTNDLDEDWTTRAGNAGEPVDLSNVAIHGKAVSRMNDDMPIAMVYFTKDGEQTPIDYANRE